MKEMWNELSIESTTKGEVVAANQRLFIPRSIRHELLKDIHSTHACVKKM